MFPSHFSKTSDVFLDNCSIIKGYSIGYEISLARTYYVLEERFDLINNDIGYTFVDGVTQPYGSKVLDY